MRLEKREVVKIIDRALDEDIGTGDITTGTIIGEKDRGRGVLLAKEQGVIAGLEVARLVFWRIDPELDFRPLIEEGSRVAAGSQIAEIEGRIGSILTGERLALNFLQRISGIATKTARYVELVSGFDLRITDTRKTTPGLRVLEKYAVRAGGGSNHRMGLYDAVLIKDNHIRAAGGIEAAIERVRAEIPHTMKIEVETTDLSEVREALQAGADVILLDNMTPSQMSEAVELAAGEVPLEASGGITEEDLALVAETGVDIISLGTLTHTISALDISLDLVE